MIEREITAGIASENILLMGISHGGYIALHTALCFPRRLAGVVTLSTYLSTANELVKKATWANADMPIFMAHGNHDEAVDIKYGKAGFNFIQECCYPVQGLNTQSATTYADRK